jgi:hypothetical protein
MKTPKSHRRRGVAGHPEWGTEAPPVVVLLLARYGLLLDCIDVT